MMEGVILDGTGRFARLDGWTAAGKTGTAQKIDPSTGRYSRTQFIASFTRICTINNPAVTILISLDSPVGYTRGDPRRRRFFKRVAEQVLPYLDVPRDVPVTAKLVQASYKARNFGSAGYFARRFQSCGFECNAARCAKFTAACKNRTEAPSVTVALDEAKPQTGFGTSRTVFPRKSGTAMSRLHRAQRSRSAASFGSCKRL